MQQTKFDELTKALAGTRSRRDALKLIATASIGGLFGLGGVRSVFGNKIKCGGNTPNSDCAHWCAQVFGANRSAANKCTSDAAHGTGVCCQCGSTTAPGSICCVRNSKGYCNGTSAATCCSGSTPNCCSGTCSQCCSDSNCTNGNTCSSSHTCVCGSNVACTGSTTCVNGSCCPNAKVCGSVCCDSGHTCIGGTCCIGAGGAGEACDPDHGGLECCSGLCCRGTCCGSGQVCDFSTGTCVSCIPDRDVGCSANSDCCSGVCCQGSVCCSAGETCVDFTCCPSGRACTSACCSPDRICQNDQCCIPSGGINCLNNSDCCSDFCFEYTCL